MCQKISRYTFLPLLLLPLLVMAAEPGTLASFLDSSCYSPSIVNPTIDLPVNTCLVPQGGAQSFAVQVLPPCTSGRATLVMYLDTSCARPVDSNRDYKNCFWSIDDNVPAIQFVCRDVSKGAVPTSTSTATFGSSIIPVAGAAAATSAAGGEPTTERTSPSSNENTSPTSRSSNANGSPPTSTSTSDPQAPTSPGTGNNDNSDDGAGISRRAQIALAVGVPIAAIVVALLAWWFPCRKARKEGWFHHHEMGQMQQQQQQPHSQQHLPNWTSPVSPVQELPAATKGYGYHSSEYYGPGSRSY